MKPKESDWKAFREMVPNLRERYLSEKNKTLLTILTHEDHTPTERFWDTFHAMKQISKILTDSLDGHSRSNMSMYIMIMLRHGIMKEEDLAVFSDELREWADRVRERGEK